MRSRAMSHIEYMYFHRGSLLIEVLIAISIFSVCIVSVFSLVSSTQVLQPILQNERVLLAHTREVFDHIYETGQISSGGILRVWNGDFSEIISATSTPIQLAISDMSSYIGKPLCSPIFSELNGRSPTRYIVEKNINTIESGVTITGIQVHHGTVYLSGDASTQSKNDFFIYDKSHMISSLNTGPGLAGLVISGNYAYTAHLSTVSQMQVIDISDREHPTVVAHMKLPLPDASSTAPHATSIYFDHDRIYLGTEKWNGPEFNIIDVSTPSMPIYLGGYEVGSAVHEIQVRDMYAYVATAASAEYQVLSVKDTNAIFSVETYTPLGWQIESGNSLFRSHGVSWLGRAGGGFNTSQYQELVKISTSTSGVHIPGGVYGIVVEEPYVFIATGSEIQVWSTDLSQKVTSIPLGVHATGLTCDGDDMYASTDDPVGFIHIVFI